MPRTDHDDSRRWLREQLAACGFDAAATEIWIERFKDENLSAKHVRSMSLLLSEVQTAFDAERERFKNELQSEKALRQVVVDRIKEFVGKSISGFKSFANQVETAGKLGYWLSPEGRAAFLENLSDEPAGPM